MLSSLVTGQLAVLFHMYGFYYWGMATIQTLVVVLNVIGFWKILEKMGEKPWKALIPFYNIYLIFKNTWKTVYFFVVIVLIVAQVGLDHTYTALNFHAPWAFYISYFLLDAVVAAIIIIEYYRIIKSFDCDTGMIIGFILLEPIFILILGFNKSKYHGNMYLDYRNQVKQDINSDK